MVIAIFYWSSGQEILKPPGDQLTRIFQTGPGKLYSPWKPWIIVFSPEQMHAKCSLFLTIFEQIFCRIFYIKWSFGVQIERGDYFFLDIFSPINNKDLLLKGRMCSQMDNWLLIRRSSVWYSSPFFCWDWSWNILYMVILSFPLIQEGQLLFTGERMCSKYWLTISRSKSAQLKCG